MSCSILWKFVLVIFKLVRPVESFCGEKKPQRLLKKALWYWFNVQFSHSCVSFLFIAVRRLYICIKRRLFHQKSIEILHLCSYFNKKSLKFTEVNCANVPAVISYTMFHGFFFGFFFFFNRGSFFGLVFLSKLMLLIKSGN